MKMLLAFAVGFVLGGSGGSRARGDVVDSFEVIKDSDEVTAALMVARSQVGHALRRVADLVDGQGREEPVIPDLVARVRDLVDG